MHGKVAAVAGDALHPLILADVQAVVLGDLAIVFERFLAIRLLIGAAEGDVADFQQLRRGEEGHVGGIVEQRVAEAAFVDQHGAEAVILGIDGAGQAGGSGSYDEYIAVGGGVGRGVGHMFI